MATEQRDELLFNYKAPTKGSKGVLSATLRGQAIHTEKLDLADPEERARVIKAVCKGRRGIDRREAAEKLEELAGNCIEDGGGDGERRSQADVMVELAADAELFHDGETAFAAVIVAGPASANGTSPGDPPGQRQGVQGVARPALLERAAKGGGGPGGAGRAQRAVGQGAVISPHVAAHYSGITEIRRKSI